MNEALMCDEPSVRVEQKNSLEFHDFLKIWDENYREGINKIELFNPHVASMLSKQQKSYFVKAFYHIRGHFHDFLWHMGNHAPDVQTKNIILNNISEEFGGHYGSHEQLYYLFAESMGVDIQKEIIEETTYEPYIVEFNKGHLAWLRNHNWMGCLAAFSAYEHLDNIDYFSLSTLANGMGASKKGIVFFKVHEKVCHFDPLKDLLLIEWAESSATIIEGFNFIGSHQLKMWRDLSKRILENGFICTEKRSFYNME